MDNAGQHISSATLIITIGGRLKACAQRVVTEYNIGEQATSNRCLVFGSSLVHSREDQPGGQVIARQILPGNYISNPDAEMGGIYAFDQVDLSDLKKTVEKMWRDFREHVTRTRAFSKEPEIARDQIVILADAWDPTCSFVLIPTLYCLRQLTYEADEIEISVIIDTSHFDVEKTSTNQEALQYRLINELEHRIDPNPKLIHDPLLESIELSDDLEFEDFRFFIINEEKEGGLYANSHQEIEEVIYSFLLGFVDPRLRDSLFEGVNPDSQRKNRTFFSSFGSVGMSENPELAIEYCGLKLSLEIINNGFLEERASDRGLINQLSDNVIANLGETNQWFQELILKPDFFVTKVGQSSNSISYDLPEIPWTAPEIDQIDICPYINDVDLCYKKVREKLIGEMDFLENNIRLKTNSILRNRKELIYKLLKQPNVIPGFMTNLRFVLKIIKGFLEKRQHEAEETSKSLADYSQIEKQFDDAKKRFSDVLQSIADPPAWFGKIPEGRIKKLIRMILKTLQAAKYMELDKARDKVEISLTRLICHPYEKVLNEFNLNVSNQSLQIIEDLDSNLNEFEENLIEMDSNFLERIEKIKENLNIEGKKRNFVYDPLNEQVSDRLFEKFKPNQSMLFSDLVSQNQWVLRWIENKSENPSQELYEFSTSHFSGIKDIGLPRMIEKYAEEKLPGEKFYKRLSNFTDRVLLLFNPEAFVMGENANPSSRNVALFSKGGDAFWSDFMNCQTKEWKEHVGVSTHIASFITVRHGFSLIAIEHLFAKGKAQWEALSDSEKKQFDIVSSKDKNPPRAKAEHRHDGKWRITYNWNFTPTGSKKDYPFEASIEVDQTNYRDLVSRERYNGQFHLYAEEKSSELNQLVNEFRRIQRQHNWDTFDQASNVLSFVQSFISYRYDKDTRYVEEYPRYPLETLWDRVGDCEDFAILSGSILSRLGFKVALLLYKNPGHLAFGVETSKNDMVDKLIVDPKYHISYYYGEGTSKGWQLGEIPVDYLGVTPVLYRINESSWIDSPEKSEPAPESQTD